MVFLRPECERVTQTEGRMEAICIARDWGVIEAEVTGGSCIPQKLLKVSHGLLFAGLVWGSSRLPKVGQPLRL